MSSCAYCGSLEPLVVEKDGFRSETSICVWGGRWCIRTRAFIDEAGVGGTFIPIDYCPFCGRALKDETPPELYIDYRTKRHSRSWRSDADERDVSFDGEEMTSETSGAVARTLLERWEDMA